MARIRPYESQVSPNAQIPAQNSTIADVGGPGAEKLGESIVNAGYAGAHAYQILQAFEDSRAVSNTHVALAKLMNEATQTIAQKKATADPNDPDFFNTVYRDGAPQDAEDPTDSIKGQLSSLKEQVTNPVAKIHFDQAAQAITSNVLQQAVAFQGHLAGVAAKQQAIKLTDSLQTMVQTDPSQHANALAYMQQAVDDPNGIYSRPGMDAGIRDGLKRDMTNQITGSAIRGWIQASPQVALDNLQKGKWDNQISGEQKVLLTGAAETQIRAMEVEARRAEAEKLRQQKAKYDLTDQAFGAKFALHQANPGVPQYQPLTATEIGKALQTNQIDGPTGRAWINMIEENARRGPVAVRTNETIERSLFKRIYLPDNDPNKIIDTQPIYDAYLKKQLSDTDMGRLRDELVKSRSPEGSQFGKEKAEFLKGIEPQITKPGPFGIYADPTTPERFASFQRELEATVAQFRKDGKDPRTLFDPSSKDYFGNVAKSSKYQSTGFGSITPAPTTTPAPSTQPRKSLDEIFGIKK